jgi:hypothetical protein
MGRTEPLLTAETEAEGGGVLKSVQLVCVAAKQIFQMAYVSYKQKRPRQCVGVGWPGVPEEQVDDQRCDDGAHDGCRHEEGVPVRQGGAGGEIEYEVVVDPGALPHEEVAPIQEDVQADECKHAAEAKAVSNVAFWR